MGIEPGFDDYETEALTVRPRGLCWLTLNKFFYKWIITVIQKTG